MPVALFMEVVDVSSPCVPLSGFDQRVGMLRCMELKRPFLVECLGGGRGGGGGGPRAPVIRT